MRRIWVIWVVVAGLSVLGAQTPRATDGSLTIEEVLRDSKAGLTDELIIARVKRNAKAFDLNPDEIVALSNAGVSAMVIKYLIEPSLPYSPPPTETAF